MSYIVEFEAVAPILDETLQTVPDIVIEYENLYISPEGGGKFFFWAYGDNFHLFEDALETESTVAEYEGLTKVENKRLYRVSFNEKGMGILTYPVASQHDMVFLTMTLTHGWSQFTARVPTRDALTAYRVACEERDIPFRLKRIYSENRLVGDGDLGRYSVTRAQREALVAAYEYGYFDVPRETTLEEIASELNVSTQALSTRLRRGHTNLIRGTLAGEKLKTLNE